MLINVIANEYVHIINKIDISYVIFYFLNLFKYRFFLYQMYFHNISIETLNCIDFDNNFRTRTL